MHKTITKHIINCLFLSLLFLPGCKKSNDGNANKSFEIDSSDLVEVEQGEVTVQHAHYFAVENLKNGYKLYILSPSGTDTLQRFALIPFPQSRDYKPADNERLITIPCNRMALMSDTFVGAMEVLNARHLIIGTSDVQTLFDTQMRDRAKEGLLVSMSNTGINNVERALAYGADLMMVSYHTGCENDYKQTAQSPMAIMFNLDWTEQSLLARAEWIKVLGMLAGKSATAEKMYQEMESRYNALRAKAATAKNRPHVFWGNTYNDIWYIPAQDSYVSKMLNDAGGEFISPTSTQSSVPLSFEKVLTEHQNDDVWFAWQGNDVKTLRDFAATNSRYKMFKAFQNKKVYTNNKRIYKKGNDYFEQGPYHPDLILEDMIRIIHPTLLPADTLHYFRHLQ